MRNFQLFISLISVISISVISVPCFADDVAPPVAPNVVNPLARQIDNLVRSELSAHEIPGYAIAVIKDGNVVIARGYGVADRETQKPVTTQTVFGLASLTKTFTALTLLSLVDRGLINLDAPLEKYLRDVPREYRSLTIRQLASMTAGVPSRAPQEVVWAEQLKMLSNMPLVSQPGSQYLYSNYSFRLLGSVIEQVTKESFFDMVQSIILTPNHMNLTASAQALAGTGLVATPYVLGRNGANLHPIEYKDPAVNFSSGMLASNIEDLLKYVRALLSRQMLSKAGYENLWYSRPPLSTGKPSPWAFGWRFNSTSNECGGAATDTMNGGLNGVASSIIILPEKNSAVISLCNFRKPYVYAIANKVAKLAFGGGAAASEPSPSPDTSAPMDDSELPGSE